jgi:hypothetical protein
MVLKIKCRCPARLRELAAERTAQAIKVWDKAVDASNRILQVANNERVRLLIEKDEFLKEAKDAE